MKLSDKKLIFVTGKGGVGKSVCAAGVAWSLAKEGKRVCLFELGSQSFYESFFETRGIGYEPSEVVSDLHISLLTPESSLREYILHFLKVPKLYDIFFQNKVMKAFLSAAPGLSELSILGKLTSEIRGVLHEGYDAYVVDCYSTGHALALLRAPDGVSHAFTTGNLADQAREISEVLKNPKLVHFVLVTLPEEMPVSEGSELYAKLKSEFNADITVVCNKLMVPPLNTQERKNLESSVHDAGMKVFLEFLNFKENLQVEQLGRLSKLAGEFYGVPQILNAKRAQDYVEEVAHGLEKPWTSNNS